MLFKPLLFLVLVWLYESLVLAIAAYFYFKKNKSYFEWTLMDSCCATHIIAIEHRTVLVALEVALETLVRWLGLLAHQLGECQCPSFHTAKNVECFLQGLFRWISGMA